MSTEAITRTDTVTKPVTILVNKKEVVLPDDKTTGLEIKKAACVPLDFTLYRKGAELDEVKDGEHITVRKDEQFITVATAIPVTILVNKKEVVLLGSKTTGLEIKKAAEVPLDFTLYRKGAELDEVKDEEHITVHKGEQFVAVSGQDVS